MKLEQNTGILLVAVTCSTLILLPLSRVWAQGSIFGDLRSSDLSIPPDGAIQFFGITNNTDKEVRIQSCIGAGYEGGYWFDDFQNFLVKTAGLPYRYYFFDTANAEKAVLSKTIPNNSFQQEDVTLAAGSFPGPAMGLLVTRLDATTVRLDWLPETGVTWHVYRRDGSSGGSFFRIDNLSGNLSDRGETQPFYVDINVDSASCYSYVLISESTPGAYSPASEVMYIDLTSCCAGIVGDVNGIGGDEPSIGDIAVLIDHLFISYTAPECLPEADVNQSGGLHPTAKDISIVDVALLIDHLFINYIPLPRCSDAAPRISE